MKLFIVRLRNLQKKEQKQGEEGAGAPSSTGAGSSGESASLPSSPTKRPLSNEGELSWSYGRFYHFLRSLTVGSSSSNKKARVVSSEEGELLSSQVDSNGVTSDTAKPKKVRQPKPKSQWEVTPDIQNGLEQFKIIFEGTGIKLSKSAHIPHTLEASLHLLNTIVLAINPSALHMAGYVEAVHEILGGEIPAGRVKGLLVRLVAKDKAATKKQELNQMIEKLCADLKPLVVVCPDSMQPANKAKAAAAAAAATSAATEVQGETEMSFDHAETSRLSMDGAALTSPASPTATATQEFVHYAWYCKWNVPTRSQLMAVLQTTCDWVKLENSHREKLTSHNIRIMTENEVIDSFVAWTEMKKLFFL